MGQACLASSYVFAGVGGYHAYGVYRSTDGGQSFRRADFSDRGVQVWSFLHDDTDPKLMLAGGSRELEAHARSQFAAPRDDALFRVV